VTQEHCPSFKILREGCIDIYFREVDVGLLHPPINKVCIDLVGGRLGEEGFVSKSLKVLFDILHPANPTIHNRVHLLETAR
jgi:hypothetical protein